MGTIALLELPGCSIKLYRLSASYVSQSLAETSSRKLYCVPKACYKIDLWRISCFIPNFYIDNLNFCIKNKFNGLTKEWNRIISWRNFHEYKILVWFMTDLSHSLHVLITVKGILLGPVFCFVQVKCDKMLNSIIIREHYWFFVINIPDLYLAFFTRNFFYISRFFSMPNTPWFGCVMALCNAKGMKLLSPKLTRTVINYRNDWQDLHLF